MSNVDIVNDERNANLMNERITRDPHQDKRHRQKAFPLLTHTMLSLSSAYEFQNAFTGHNMRPFEM